ncbi:MAG: CYTH domain-containing protein [Flavobacteriaceae bacterium]|nr:MAG: CYTH domain-containing protein [Flavobacteriaceae bacterium]
MVNKEIERKFLVLSDDFKKESFKNERIVQGFLSSVPERTVRIRITGQKGFITIKGIGNSSGTTRFEWEKEIDVKEAENLLVICEPGTIEKVRYFVKSGVHIFEVDEFGLENQGLTIAEIELADEEESFAKPKWLGAEVTGQVKYYNSSLARKPFNQW